MSFNSALHTAAASTSPPALPTRTSMPIVPIAIPPTPSSASSSASAPASMPARRGGRKAGSQNWTADKLTVLLDKVQAVLPRGVRDWDLVTSQYNHAAADNADIDRVRNKFLSLTSVKKPTGKHTRPDHVSRALMLAEQMARGGSGGGGGGGVQLDEIEDEAAEAKAENPGDISFASPAPLLGAPRSHALAFPGDRLAAPKRPRTSTEVVSATSVLNEALERVTSSSNALNEALARVVSATAESQARYDELRADFQQRRDEHRAEVQSIKSELQQVRERLQMQEDLIREQLSAQKTTLQLLMQQRRGEAE